MLPKDQYLPFMIKRDIITDFMFSDIQASILDDVIHDKEFIYAMFRGLKPRFFRSNDPDDCIICEENQAVEELLFMLSGTVKVGFSRLAFFSSTEGLHVWKSQFTGKAALCAYYVLSKVECDFIHRASEDVTAYGLDLKFIHQDLFEKGNRYTD